MNRILRFIDDDQGADLIEYALLVGLIALAMVGSLQTTQGAIAGLFADISAAISGVPVGAPAP